MSPLRFDPLDDGISAIELIDSMGDDARIVAAARVSTGLDAVEMDIERDAKLLRYLLKHGHWSCFEHCFVTVCVTCPMPLARQWQRHRSWSFNEVSRRYTSDDLAIYTPRAWRGQGSTNRQASEGLLAENVQEIVRRMYQRAINLGNETYEALIALGVAREQARFVLPQATYTRFYATTSLRSALHFVGLRDDPTHAQAEIVSYARALGDILAARWPVTMAAWTALREAA